ncbi:MAG: metallopeptidase TldD-related protein [Spirochaetes bacterium]|nr:metallopeptidase TldD-related protein [Spirochaetota bacterium]
MNKKLENIYENNKLNLSNSLKAQDDISILINNIISYINKTEFYIVGKIKICKLISSSITNGNINNYFNIKEAGIGFHLFDKNGFSIFVSTFDLNMNKIKALINNGMNLLKKYNKICNDPNKNIFELQPIKARLEKKSNVDIDKINSEKFQRDFLEFYNNLPKENDISYSIGISLKNIDNFIFRSDGTDIYYNEFYSIITGDLSISSNSKASIYYKIHKFGLDILNDKDKLEEFLSLTSKNNKLVKDLSLAENVDGGSYNLIIDYALAKGLAHEAFGHAAETDFVENSILSKNGIFNKGLKVGKSFLNIIDESFDNEWAYTPFSDYGLIRKKVYIVKDGILNNGLSDVFSYKKAQTELTGAERSERYSDIPIPRMSNIRIELNPDFVYKDNIFNKNFNEIKPSEILNYVLENKLFKNDKDTLLLSGYSGGQVDTVKGNFVFNCQAIYKVENNKIKIFKPSVFSGITLKTLDSISFGIGNLKLDAIGRCGKSGQSVNSSGGSHYFLGINYNENIIIGGK